MTRADALLQPSEGHSRALPTTLAQDDEDLEHVRPASSLHPTDSRAGRRTRKRRPRRRQGHRRRRSDCRRVRPLTIWPADSHRPDRARPAVDDEDGLPRSGRHASLQSQHHARRGCVDAACVRARRSQGCTRAESSTSRSRSSEAQRKVAGLTTRSPDYPHSPPKVKCTQKVR